MRKRSLLTKPLFWGLLLGGAFAAGYLAGTQDRTALHRTLDAATAELADRIRDLEDNLKKTRFRLNLVNAKNHLLVARSKIQTRDFGQAAAAVHEAEKTLAEAFKAADPAGRNDLAVLREALKDVAVQIRRSNPGAASGVEETIRALERFSERD